MKTSYNTITPYITKDRSVIRELMHPDRHGSAKQSLAEAIIPSGAATLLHEHRESEELYHITAGAGRMFVGGEEFAVREGDTVCIPPGTPHCVRNDGPQELRILCCCSPAYTHEDTILLETGEYKPGE